MVPPPLAARLAASRAGPVALRRAQARVPAAVPPSCRRAGARGVMMFMDCQAHSSPMALLLSGRAELHTTAVLQSGTENANMNSIADPFDMPFEDSDEGGESDGEEPCEGAQAEPPAASAEADEKRAGGAAASPPEVDSAPAHTLPLPPERQGEGAPAPRSGPRTLSLRVVLPSLPSSRCLAPSLPPSPPLLRRNAGQICSGLLRQGLRMEDEDNSRFLSPVDGRCPWRARSAPVPPQATHSSAGDFPLMCSCFSRWLRLAAICQC
ncbi:unnamed protein product [Prorocentrum cordatum]|uniref:Uncharacterized protein n=1 Tax=Prorocentrum cordatum TaxID=2364126 RepID=A0ABN9TNT2_9DINO|nr:unnamed protein product [Polarella glacialis]